MGGRFYVNSALAVDECVCLIGEREVNAGGSILYPNVLNQSEIDAIKALVSNDHAKKATWDSLIDKLPRTPVEPSTLGVAANGKARVDYVPKDHYAITAMGATNYVTIIENDSTNVAMRVEDGDPVSMHVFRVTDDYYPGRVVTREDPLNLLSQQLAILYTESFAGKADDYEFEWKKAKPNLDGSMPDNYEKGYADVFDSGEWGGLTPVYHYGKAAKTYLEGGYAIQTCPRLRSGAAAVLADTPDADVTIVELGTSNVMQQKPAYAAWRDEKGRLHMLKSLKEAWSFPFARTK